jgi:Fibronectin type III domain/Bacterial Ig-like domain (group 2)
MLLKIWRRRSTPGSHIQRSPARSTRPFRFRPEILQLEDRLVPTVTVTGGWNAVNNSGWYPPDTVVAAGPNHVVEIVNESLAIYAKSTGSLISSEALGTLFSGLDTNGGDFDPSLFYDDQAGKFVIEAAIKDTGASKSYIDLAISKSSDPTQGFTTEQIEVDQGGKYWADNGKIGWNADAYVYTGNEYTFSGAWGQEIIVAISKSNPSTYYQSSRSSDFSMVPARMHGSSSGGPMWFLESTWSGGSTVQVVKMSNVLSNSPSYTSTTVTVNSYVCNGTPPQPGGTVDDGDARMLGVDWNNGYLVGAWNGNSGSDDAAAWALFSTTGSSPTLSQQGIIHPANGTSTYFPAVAIDSSGDIAMTYMESSASEYVSMYVTGRLSTDAPNTMETSVLAGAGTVTLSPSRSGDYGAVGLDPSAANTFWAADEYAPSGIMWGTWIAQFTVTSANNDDPPTVATPASASPNPVTGMTTNLSVLGSDDDGESSLTYTWAVTSQPGGVKTPTFDSNGTNAAKNAKGTFYAAGNYTFQVTITDPSGLTVASSINVTVDQTYTSVSVLPASVTLPNNGTQQFTASALDQFGQAMASQPSFTWSIDLGGLGAINGTGLYTAPSTGSGSAMVRATSGSLSNTASVTVSALPAAPTNLTAVAVSKNQVNLVWVELSTGVTGFHIQRSPNGGSSWTTIATVSGATLTYSDKTLRRNRTYEYRVDAFNGSGTSGWSNIATVTTPNQEPAPAFPAPDLPSQLPTPRPKHHVHHVVSHRRSLLGLITSFQNLKNIRVATVKAIRTFLPSLDTKNE